jgi:hypothetical protein
MLKLAILAAATQLAVGVSLLIAGFATAWACGWKASMELQPDGRRTRVWWLLVVGGCLAAIGFVALGVLPALQPAQRQ